MSSSDYFLDQFAKLARGSIEPSFRWVRVKLGLETVADSKTPLLLAQFGLHVSPTYFFTRDEITMDRLVPSGQQHGMQYWSVTSESQMIKDGAWTYIDPPEHLADLKERITFNWRDFDWFEEDEQVFVEARMPQHRVDVMRSSRHIKVVVGGQVLADTKTPFLLFETTLPTRYYIPQQDVQMKFLHETSLKTQCPYKGTARYWSAHVGANVFENVVWSYPNPILENPKIKDLMCFYNEKVDIYIDGQLEPRPVTPFS